MPVCGLPSPLVFGYYLPGLAGAPFYVGECRPTDGRMQEPRRKETFRVIFTNKKGLMGQI